MNTNTEINLKYFVIKQEELQTQPLGKNKQEKIVELINDLKKDRFAFNNSNLELSEKKEINKYINAKIKFYTMQMPSDPLSNWMCNLYPTSLLVAGLAMAFFSPIPLVGEILAGIGGTLLAIRLIYLVGEKIYLNYCRNQADEALHAIKNKNILIQESDNSMVGKLQVFEGSNIELSNMTR